MVTSPAKHYQIFLTILKIGVFGFGGGPATIPLFHKEVIEKYKWLTDEEFSDMLAIANTLPGPTQTKLAGYIGYQLKGILGMLSALIAMILPSLLIMLFFITWISNNYDKPWVKEATSSVLPVVTVMMLALTWQFLKKSNKALGLKNHFILLFIAIIVLAVFNIHPAFLIILFLIAAFLPNMKDLKRFLFIGIFSLLMILFVIFNLDQTISQIFLNLHIFPYINNGAQYLQIFFAFFIPGIIGYGGGPASISLVGTEVIEHFHFLTSDSFGLFNGVQAALPGVTATKLAGAIGYQVGGVPGAFIGVFAYVAPSLILMISLLKLLNKYKTSPVVKRLTSYVGPIITILLGLLVYKFFHGSLLGIGWIQTICILIVSFILLQKYKVHPFFVILLAMIYGSLYGVFII